MMDVIGAWRENREYEWDKRKVWQDVRGRWSTQEPHLFQDIAKAWKDAYDIGFKEIDDGNVV